MISVSQTVKLLVQNRPNRDIEDVDLNAALGLQCAVNLIAKLSMPPFDASAMDGYAVKLSDAKSGTRLTVSGEAPAGSPSEGDVSNGEAVRIFTGGQIPAGAETVVIQENVTRSDGAILINESQDRIHYVRKAGMDFLKGDVLVPKGRIMGPADITLAASGNNSAVKIYRTLKVAILASGNELKPPGSELKPGEIIGSNSLGLAAMVRNWGADLVDLGIVADNLSAIVERIETAKQADIVVPIGGASVGDYDYMRAAFKAAGFRILFDKVAVKPGKPTWFAAKGKQRVLGLPGNPASASVCAHLFLKPLLGLCETVHLVDAVLGNDISANGPRETYLRGRLSLHSLQLRAESFPRQDSSLITPLAEANALIQLPSNAGPWAAGDIIKVMHLGVGPSIF